MDKVFSFMRDNLLMSLKIMWKYHSLKIPLFLSESFEEQEIKHLRIHCPIAAARFSLESLSADSLMPTSDPRSPSVKFRSPSARCRGSYSVSSASSKKIFFRNFTQDYRMHSWSWEFSKWKKYSPFKHTKFH